MAVVGALAAAALALGACSNNSDGGDGGDAGKDASAGIIKVNRTEPQNPLISTNTNEVGGGWILDMIFSGLAYYTADGSTELDVAESIESEDTINWTIKLKPDQKFTNGDPVDADSFINAWNYGASVMNDQLQNSFFVEIKGYEDVNKMIDSGEKNEDGTAKLIPDPDQGQELSGLVKVDDLTFTVELSNPDPDFTLRLGYSAYYPMPISAFDDMEAFGQAPASNGPYKLASDDAWEHNVKIDLVANPDYTGPRKAQNGGITFVFYETVEAAYQDLLSGQLDIVDSVPDFKTFEQDLGERAVNQASATFQAFTVPDRLAHFGGEEGKLRRQAISMAIDRAAITETIFSGTRTPAKDFTSPVMPGYSDSIPGNEVLEYNEAKAKELWAQADAISPWEGTFQIAYNADGGHADWVEAVLNSIHNTLGVETAPAPYPTFQESRTAITDRTIQTPFRSGWQADYPSLYNYLQPLYGTGGGANDADYSNKTFDDLLVQGLAQATPAEAAKYYNQAQELVLEDLPAIPLWYANVTAGYSENVGNVIFGWNQVPLLYQVTTK
ncbi:MAG: ABC transporter substrate-binding protein [Bifidobacteriaceae bacterium]|nr:ABC transporter substrate-binding protein [Bifidobacteriaceae bacterium]